MDVQSILLKDYGDHLSYYDLLTHLPPFGGFLEFNL